MIAVSSTGFACLALLVGMLLYYRISVLRKYLIQPALLGGIFLLALGSQGTAMIAQENYDTWSRWPGFLISFLFSTLILAAPDNRSSSRSIGPVFFQGGYVWILALGQIAAGLAVISFFDSRWWVAGHIIEIGWMGGHGSAAALIAVADDLGHREAAELALFSATIGLLYGSISGMLFINIIKRKFENDHAVDSGIHYSKINPGRLSGNGGEGPDRNNDAESSTKPGLDLDENAGWLISIIAAVLPVAVAYFFLELLSLALARTYPDASMWLGKLPLFFIALLFAFPVRKILQAWNILDTGHARILNSLILEVLIVSAIATLNLGLLLDSWEILLSLTLIGALWTAFCFFWIAPRLLDHHPDLAIINYGMSTGVTALGLLLLRSYRNRIPSEPATIYGLAAPFSAPFIGGGIISLLLPIWTLEFGPLSLSLVLCIIVICLLLSLLWFRRSLSGKN